MYFGGLLDLIFHSCSGLGNANSTTTPIFNYRSYFSFWDNYWIHLHTDYYARQHYNYQEPLIYFQQHSIFIVFHAVSVAVVGEWQPDAVMNASTAGFTVKSHLIHFAKH